MNKKILPACAAIVLSTAGLASCAQGPAAPRAAAAPGSGLVLSIAPGASWLHRFNAFLDNPPQFAVWAETEDGAYAATLFVTKKAATEGWVFNGGDRREAALPVWAHRRGEKAADGGYLPTKKAPLADAVSGATPKAAFEKEVPAPFPSGGPRRWVVWAEFNHSTDFDARWPADAAKGSPAWTGGAKGGSGQPSIVYRGLVDLDAPGAETALEGVGRGSPDGSDGKLVPGLADLSSAKEIVASLRLIRR